MATPYTFTQPIRYYKANDPYYYEVDNIPLRQLEENILYIKNRLEGSGGQRGALLTENSELSIYKIKELRPTSVGERTVKVNAGRFVSRINDAFEISFPLNKLLWRDAAGPTGTTIIPELGTGASALSRDAIWSDFINQSSRPANINGVSFTFTFHNTPGGMGSHWRTKTGAKRKYGNFPQYAGAGDTTQFAWPGSQIYDLLTPQDLGQYIGFDQGNYISTNLPLIHLAFVQMWRGVFRTSVVDFDDSTIEIPSWSDDDFYYYDDNGNKVQISNVNQRIDLLVAYSLPIDSSGTSINNYEDGYCDDLENAPVPQKMTVPTLGLVRGAGLGIHKNAKTSPVSVTTVEGCGNPGIAGSQRIVGNQNDDNIKANTGITTLGGNKIHGSFPSPDDLINMAPNLALNVAENDFQLIGQAALPIAYVVVKKGVSAITEEDIIDIRPFLRTTEFTYNERAGIAGANPPLSLANPAVGAYQLQDIVKKLEEQSTQGPQFNEGNNNGKALYTDYIMGGLAYGVEGTMLTMCDAPQGQFDPFGGATVVKSDFVSPGDGQTYDFGGATPYSSSKAYLEDADTSRREAFLEYIYAERQLDLKKWISDPNTPIASQANLGTYLGFPAGNEGRNIPLYPEWDMPVDSQNYATMIGNGNVTLMSPKPTWWMWVEAQDDSRPLAYVPGSVISNKSNTNTSEYLTKGYGFGYGVNKGVEVGRAVISTVTKALEITFPSWVVDYDVLVEYVNCGPVTSTAADNAGVHHEGSRYGIGSGLMVNKGPLGQYGGEQKAVIRINSAAQPWPEAQDGYIESGRLTDREGSQSTQTQVGGAGVAGRLWQNLSYAVCLPQFRQTKFRTRKQSEGNTIVTRYTPKFGAAYYPTVKFTIIGYQVAPITQNTTYNRTNNYTMIQNVSIGNPGALTNDPVTGANAPLQGVGINTRINIATIS